MPRIILILLTSLACADALSSVNALPARNNRRSMAVVSLFMGTSLCRKCAAFPGSSELQNGYNEHGTNLRPSS